MAFVVIQTILLAGLAVSFLRSGTPLWISPHGVVIVGAAVNTLAGALAVVAGISLGRATRLAPQPGPNARFVERGVYRHLRHPMYTAGVLLGAGCALMRPAAAVLAFGAAVIVFYLVKARYEERILLAHYPQYAAYRARTRGVLLRRGH